MFPAPAWLIGISLVVFAAVVSAAMLLSLAFRRLREQLAASSARSGLVRSWRRTVPELITSCENGNGSKKRCARAKQNTVRSQRGRTGSTR